MIRSSLVSFVALALGLQSAGCCFTPGPAPATTAPAPTAAPAVMPSLAAPTAAASITLGPGFMPDPTTVMTFAGGPISASTYATADTYCAGYIAAAPNVTLTTTAPIVGMRVLARATDDTTLVVRLADGRVLCNDDGGGYPNPAIDIGLLPPGVHQIYVGSFHMGETPFATVGFTTNAFLANTSLP